MPIPALDSRGILPVGVHECTLPEIQSAFGQFQGTDRRPQLFAQLERYVRDVRAAGVGRYLIVDGSFVTSKPDPNDIDVLLVLRDDVDFSVEVPPFQYNARSRKYVKREYKLDFYVGFEGDYSSSEMLTVFSQVREDPAVRKGVLRTSL